MIRLFTGLSALALLAGCIPPQGISSEDLEGFDLAVASIGCVLQTERQYLPVELQTGLTRDQVVEVAAYKVSIRQAVSLEDGGVRSVVGACEPVEAPAEPVET